MTGRRRAVAVSVALVAALNLAVPGAKAGDVADLLAEAQSATFNAQRVTVSVWGSKTQVSDQWVEHWSGGELVRTNSVWSVYGNGRAVMMGDEPQGFAFMTSRTVPTTDRYSLGTTYPVAHMRRPAERLEVLEGDMTRAVLIVDTRTGAILHSEVYSDDGRIFRTMALDDFKPYRVYPEAASSSAVPVEIVMHMDDSGRLPASVAGYALVDAFTGPGGSEQGFYSDGFFSFSLFVIDDATRVAGFETPMAFVTDGGVYDMVPSAQDVRLYWKSHDARYVLVGDLPPDHARDVVNDLPLPDTRNMIERWWHRLFG